MPWAEGVAATPSGLRPRVRHCPVLGLAQQPCVEVFRVPPPPEAYARPAPPAPRPACLPGCCGDGGAFRSSTTG